jgi:hypothetical protein
MFTVAKKELTTVDIEKLLKIKADIDRPRSAIDQMREVMLRDIARPRSAIDQMREAILRESSALNASRFYDDLVKGSNLNATAHLLKSNEFQKISELNAFTASRYLSDELSGIMRHSPLMQAESQWEYSFQTKMTELAAAPATSAERISREFLSAIKADFSGLGTLHSIIGTETERLIRAIRLAVDHPSASQFASLTAAVNAASFTARVGLLRNLDSQTWLKSHATTQRWLEPILAYSRFAARTLAQISSPIDEIRRAALSGSLVLADQQALRTASLMAPLAEVVRPHSETFPPQVSIPCRPIINRYMFQRQELIDREEAIPEEADYETLTSLAPSTDLYEGTRRCMELVGLCDETDQTHSDATVFKLTPMVFMSFSDLLGTVASSRAGLAQVVENLYVVLYESAGADKLRYLETGYLSHDECEIIWTIKHLRNKWLGHDAEHGTDKDIQSARRMRMKALESLGFERMPTRRDDYVRIHHALVEQVEEFLSLLLIRIGKSVRSE